MYHFSGQEVNSFSDYMREMWGVIECTHPNKNLPGKRKWAPQNTLKPSQHTAILTGK